MNMREIGITYYELSDPKRERLYEQLVREMKENPDSYRAIEIPTFEELEAFSKKHLNLWIEEWECGGTELGWRRSYQSMQLEKNEAEWVLADELTGDAENNTNESVELEL